MKLGRIYFIRHETVAATIDMIRDTSQPISSLKGFSEPNCFFVVFPSMITRLLVFLGPLSSKDEEIYVSYSQVKKPISITLLLIYTLKITEA